MNRFKTFIAITVLVATICVGCTTDDDGSSDDNTVQIQEVQSTVQDGTWRITNFNDSGQDETSDFTGYNFTFASDGTLTASNGTDSLTGTWSVMDDSSSSSDDDDSSSDDDDVDFNIFFPVPDSNDFEDLNDDWDIVSISATRIELIDVSGGNGGTDRLTFEKN